MRKALNPLVTIRPFLADEAEVLAAVYRDAVRTTGTDAYSLSQVEAWARYPENLDDFRARLQRGLTLVAEIDGQAVAFGQLEPIDHLAFLYCSGHFGRRGIGSQLYQAMEVHAFDHGAAQIQTEASRISHPFFIKHGYVVRTTEIVERHGVEFERFRMSKIRPIIW